MIQRILLVLAIVAIGVSCQSPDTDVIEADRPPNILLIYTDDVGYGDVSSYGSATFETQNIDRLADEGLKFTHAHAPSASCTPSRFALLTGSYAWRKQGTGIARGDAPLIIDTTRVTLPKLMQEAGYRTAVVGKWHLGLGGPDGADWNGEIRPGPLEIGFDEAFLVPATGDRVPTVYTEGHHIVGLDPADPIAVSFDGPIGDEPTGRDNPELLKMHPSHGHDMTIVNGISRIGYMSGGHSAWWRDEDMADTVTNRAVRFIEENADRPFFLYYSSHDIHVPRVPHERFAGTSGLGPRGDAMLQLDWAVGELTATLERLDLLDNTLVIFTSDNGPVVDDGYEDQAVELLGEHEPSGPFRGGKYSAFEAGTRVPFIVRWPGEVEVGVSDVLFGQVDLMASLASFTGVAMPEEAGPDSFNRLDALLGRSQTDRDHLIEHSASGTLSIIRGNWKYIEPSNARPYAELTDIELGNDPEPQLYDLNEDRAEQQNVAQEHPEVVEELARMLDSFRAAGRTRN